MNIQKYKRNETKISAKEASNLCVPKKDTWIRNRTPSSPKTSEGESSRTLSRFTNNVLPGHSAIVDSTTDCLSVEACVLLQLLKDLPSDCKRNFNWILGQYNPLRSQNLKVRREQLRRARKELHCFGFLRFEYSRCNKGRLLGPETWILVNPVSPIRILDRTSGG